MRNRVVGISAVLLGIFILASGTVMGHHSFSAEFDGNQRVALTGMVTKVEWTNPHVWFYINVTDAETGEVTNWGAEMGPPHGLQRSGWRRDTLKIGDEVSLEGAMARNGTKRVNARNITLTATGGRPGATLDANSSEANTP